MTNDSEGRVVFITGAGRGLGRTIARHLHKEGYSVAVTDIDEQSATSLASELDSDRRKARPYRLDVRDPSNVASVFRAAAEDLGVPTALINNAGIYPDHSLLEMSEAAWDAVLSVNLKGTFLCTQVFSRTLLATSRRGAVVNVASTAAFSARIGAAHYSASKAGVVMFTKSAAQELGPYGIRVNAVAPGLAEVREDQVSEEYKKAFLSMVPRGRMGRISDIPGTVAFLLSDAADYITGECIIIDGGFLTGRPLVRSETK